MKRMLKKLFCWIFSLTAFFFYSCEEEAVDVPAPVQPPLEVYMTRGDAHAIMPTKNGYSIDTDKEYLKVFLGVSFTVVTLDTFDVQVIVNNDTIGKLIENGSLNSVEVLPEAQIQLPQKVTAPPQTISAPLNMLVDFAFIEANPGKKFAVAVGLKNPSKHKLAATKTTTIVIIDTDATVAASEIGDITEKYMKNTGHPFISTERISPGGRWGNLDHWTANDGAKSHSGFGGFNSDAGGTMGLESGWGSPIISNGKLYQTVELPAGVYTFEVAEWDWKGMKDPAYLVVAEGTAFPDFEDVENSISYSSLAGGIVEFALTERKEVSIGVLVDYVQDQQGFKIKRVRLNRLE